MLGLKVRGRTLRTPSMEMPPGKLERAKPLARDQNVDFSSSDRPGARDFFTKGATQGRAAAARTDHVNQSARPRHRERPTPRRHRSLSAAAGSPQSTGRAQRQWRLQ
jgi:hypothetical protein